MYTKNLYNNSMSYINFHSLIKKIFLISLLLFLVSLTNIVIISSYATDLVKYKISFDKNYQDSKNNNIASNILVEIKFHGNSSGKTEILIPILNGLDFESIVAKSKFKTLKIKNSKTTKKCMKTYPCHCEFAYIIHEANEEITLSYTIKESPGIFSSSNTIVFEGGKLLVYPKLNNTNKINATFDFSDLKMMYGKVMSPSTLKDIPNTLTTTKETFFSNCYIFSNMDINATSVNNDKLKNLLVASIGFKNKGDKLTHASLVDVSSRIAKGNQEFIDKILGKYSTQNNEQAILLIKNSDKNTDRSWRGFRTENINFIIIDEKSYIKDVAHTISHEYLHGLFATGNALSVNFGQKVEFGHFWFGEGFTDYYADLLNYRNKIISKQEYLERINNGLKIHYELYRNLQYIISNSYKIYPAVAKSLLSDDYFFKNFYYAGALIALDLDNIIQKRTHGKFRLEDLLANLINSYCNSALCYIEKKDFIDELKKLTDIKLNDSIQNYVDHYIVEFTPITPPQEIIQEDLNLNLKYKKSYNVFQNDEIDLIKSLSTGVVFGVKKGGAPYKAGLREGMKIKNFNFSFLSEDDYIEIKVENPDLTRKTIKYKPSGSIMVPYYN